MVSNGDIKHFEQKGYKLKEIKTKEPMHILIIMSGEFDCVFLGYDDNLLTIMIKLKGAFRNL